MTLTERLRYHVTGAIERGEAVTIEEIRALPAPDDAPLDGIRALAQTLALSIDETRRLLAANQPEDWQA